MDANYAIRDLLDSLVAERIFATGAQVYVARHDRVLLDIAAGTCGQLTISPAAIHPVYCASKPILAVALGHLVDRSLISLNDTVRTQHPDLHWLPEDATISSLLAHDAAMAQPSAAVWRMTPAPARNALFREIELSPVLSSYSEVSGWMALCAVLERATGLPAAAAIASLVLEPLEIREIALDGTSARAAATAGLVCVPVDGLPYEAIPLLSEQLECQLDDASPAFGGLASMRGLGRFYQGVLSVLLGGRSLGVCSSRALAELMGCRRAPQWDPVLGRECSFAGGFMTHLSAHGIGTRLTGSAIGHASGLANCVALCDPELDLVIACYLNGVTPGSDDIEFARTHLVDAIVNLVAES